MLGLIPCAGTASRLNGLPKYLLPTPDKTFLLKHCINNMIDAHVEDIIIFTSTKNLNVISTYIDLPLYCVGKTSTMSETIVQGLKRIDLTHINSFLLLMPDTYFKITKETWLKCTNRLSTCDVSLILWPIRKDQYGKLGQCEVDLTTMTVTNHYDKQINCTFPYSWGVIAWNKSVNHLIDPNTPHIGYLISKVLHNGGKVAATIVDSDYFDCGTYEEYFKMIVHTAQ